MGRTPGLSGLRDRLGGTPLTDPRSLGGSLAFHALLAVIISAAALGVALPTGEPPRPKALRAELEAVDNRAKPDGDGGGEAGPLGGERLAAALEAVAPAPPEPSGAAKPPAEALLSEILPVAPSAAAVAASESVPQTLPGPQTTGFGSYGGLGAGGGGGSGGGAGGGVGRGGGPGTEFFGTREHASSFAYVIDCSGSMATRGSLDVAKRELLNSLHQLPPDARFAVIFYNLHATILSDPQGNRGLMAATLSNKARLSHQLGVVVPDGGTDHMLALRSALTLHPEVIFFLTDADLMTQSDVATLITDAGPTRIHAIEFGRGTDLAGGNNPLRRLATASGGLYRYIDVANFPRPR